MVHFRGAAEGHSGELAAVRFRGAAEERFPAVEAVRCHGAVALAQPPVVADDSPAKRARLPDEMKLAHETPALADDR